MKNESTIHFETLAVANLVLVKRLLAFIAAKQLLDDEELQAVLEQSVTDMVRSTLPISEEGAKQALRLFLAGTGIDETVFL